VISARHLMLGYLDRGAHQSASLFAPTGTLEFPFFGSIGLPPVLKGPANIEKFLGFLHDTLYPGFKFEKVIIHIETAQQVFAEYHINNKSGISGKNVKQQFFGYLTAYQGKIQSLIEANDVIVAAEAIFPQGLAAIAEGKVSWEKLPRN
jgi:hypothetical protein